MFKRITRYTFVIVTMLFGLLFIQQSIEASTSTKRIAGSDRYETAAEISEAGWPSGANVVILTRGDLFPDALAGAPLAKKYDAPILLTSKSSLPEATENQILDLNAEKVVILGGPQAIDTTIDTNLRTLGIKVERIYGDSRYSTAVEIAKKLDNKKNEFIITTGSDFPDALAIAPYAADQSIPILLSKPDSLSSSVKETVKNADKTYIIGGKNALNESFDSLLPNSIRISGQTRYDTANEIISTFYHENPQIYVSTGTNFADALTGSILAAKQRTAILLVDQNKTMGETEYVMNRNGIQSATILGGTSAVSDKVQKELSSLLDSVEQETIGAANVSSALSKLSATQTAAIEKSYKQKINDTLQINVGKTVSETFKEGQLFAIPPTSKLPNGFMGKIISINNSMGTIIVSQPSIGDVFDKLSLYDEQSLSLKQLNKLVLNTGVSLKVGETKVSSLSKLSSISNLNSDDLTFDISSKWMENENLKMDINGEIQLQNLKTSIDTEYDSNRGTSRFNVNLDYTEKYNTTLDVNGATDSLASDSIPTSDWTTLNEDQTEASFVLGTVSYNLGNIPLLSSEKFNQVHMPISLTITFTMSSEGKITSNAQFNVLEEERNQLELTWNKDNQQFDTVNQSTPITHQQMISGRVDGALTNDTKMNIGLQIAGIIPIETDHYLTSVHNWSGEGTSNFDVLTQETLKKSGCFTQQLDILKKDTIITRLQSFERNTDTIEDKVLADHELEYCVKTGNVTGNALAGSNLDHSNISVTAIQNDELIGTTTTDQVGDYTLSLPEGAYTLSFSKEGYQTEILYDAEVKHDTTFTLPTVPLTELDKIGNGSVNGKLKDGISGEPVTHAKLIIRSGFHNSNGEILMTAYTDENGEYEFLNRLSGLYSIEVLKEGYIPYLFNTHVQKDTNVNHPDESISPLLELEKTRFILNWGNNTMDLDTHFTGPGMNNERFHLYWDSPLYKENDDLIASMDVFDEGALIGPETITLHQQKPGSYKLSVYNYSYRLHEGSSALANSEAKIDIYQNGALKKTLYIPNDQPGKLWTALELEGNDINYLNVISDNEVSLMSNDNPIDHLILPTLQKEKE
ncbi:cell wall-binding repeat-containing protein [Rossellomorea arthrocnemi]